ncbi:iron-sulfur cluster assembly scaffold protein [Mycoplasma sp. HS2188]|uniref:iron-sulfur cluster assembly scaffold protein n=2 Tax=unclassified Mycoplasma TaxID=2683645 RepID=UPI0037CB487D
MSYNQAQKREIIMSHYTNPQYKKVIEGDKNIKHGQACADYLEFKYSIKDGKLVDLHFDGRGCAFMMASTDLLISYLNNKTVEEVLNFIDKYEDFIRNGGDEETEKILGELAIFQNVNEHPNRIFCATMLSTAIKEKLNG